MPGRCPVRSPSLIPPGMLSGMRVMTKIHGRAGLVDDAVDAAVSHRGSALWGGQTRYLYGTMMRAVNAKV